jgi:two-component system, sensor histidine kinase and response regulator
MEMTAKPRSEAIFHDHLSAIVRRTDRIFFWLLIAQWIAGVAVALVWSPRTWIAQYWSVHQHVWAAFWLGGLFASYPLYLIVTRPGEAYTRHMVAAGQMLQSALLVHVTGGRIETHFHVFGSLAILAFYRDWRVFITATAVVYADHVALGLWFPLSVYGVASAPLWRSVEHAFWVVFESVFLALSCRRGMQELREIAERQSQLEGTAEELARLNKSLNREVAERKRAEAELAESRDLALRATEVKSQFLANMSHEIRTPLNGVIGMIGLLQTTRLDDRQADFLGTAASSAESLLTIINNILDISKIEAGKMVLAEEDFDLGRLLRETVELFRAQASRKGVALSLTLDSDLPLHLRGDPGRLRQVVMNLVSNAVKFTQRGGVDVRAGLHGSRDGLVPFRIAVEDTGIGISAQDAGRLFQPFTQADSSLTRRFGGTGLGLAISRQLAELMGGDLGLRSEHGRGSVFWLDMALPRAAQMRPEPPPAAARTPAPSGLHVLVVEDNPVNRKVVVAQLASMGVEADTADDGRGALRCLGERRYDAVLMDCQMPEMDGYQATREIRRREAGGGPRTFIIAMTAHAMQGDRDKCLAAGMDDYIAKPIHMEELRSILFKSSRSGASDGSGGLPRKASSPQADPLISKPSV